MRKIYFIFLLLVSICVCSCKSTQNIDKVYVHDTITTTKIVHDSVDRWRTHYEYLKGDTMYYIDTIYYARWKTKTDTLIDVVHDIEIKTEEKIVERVKYVWWPAIAIGFLSIVIFCYFFFFYRKR